MAHDESMSELEEKLSAALAPFAELGGALTKHDLYDNSPFVEIPDDQIILRANIPGWTITAGQLRRAYEVH